MTQVSTKTDLQLITDAIGTHGIFFKRALRAVLEKIPGLRILGEEYPVRYLEGASIDLLVEFKAEAATFVLPIECKRALAIMKKWIFFEDTEKDVKFLYGFDIAGLSTSQSSRIRLADDVCIEGVEIDSSKLRNDKKSPYSAASLDRIWDAAFQVCKGGLGFIQAELKARVKQPTACSDFYVFLLIVTTAPLQIATLPPGSVDLPTGDHLGELSVREVPWLILHQPFTPSSTHRSEYLQVDMEGYMDPMLRGMNAKEGIMILNAQHVTAFFEQLRQKSAQARPPLYDA